MGKFIDLTGQKFGYLSVLSKAEPYKTPEGKWAATQWLCQCDCGNKCTVRTQYLNSGHTQSCGCIKTIRTIESHIKYNTYDLDSFEYGIGYTDNNDKFIFDKEDYDKIKQYYWSLGKNGYFLNVKNQLYLHRLIMGVADEDRSVQVDHIKGNKYDNRKINLRLCNNTENSRNKGLNKNNTSGYSGVYYRKDRNKWYARITVNREEINLGHYENFDDAVKARKEAEKKYFGEFAYDYSQSI